MAERHGPRRPVRERRGGRRRRQPRMGRLRPRRERGGGLGGRPLHPRLHGERRRRPRERQRRVSRRTLPPRHVPADRNVRRDRGDVVVPVIVRDRVALVPAEARGGDRCRSRAAPSRSTRGARPPDVLRERHTPEGRVRAERPPGPDPWGERHLRHRRGRAGPDGGEPLLLRVAWVPPQRPDRRCVPRGNLRRARIGRRTRRGGPEKPPQRRDDLQGDEGEAARRPEGDRYKDCYAERLLCGERRRHASGGYSAQTQRRLFPAFGCLRRNAAP
mmetsp:Transcript_4181/g.11523  ORF Transcript_4181/g.11523 Transcript_4181/m.11523 type:complete len:273 (+) Transcript_4181:821-1639(+)